MNAITAWRRTRERPRTERRLLVRTAAMFLYAHLLLRVRSLEQTRSALARFARRRNVRAEDPERLSWAIAAVNRNLPGQHSCLIDALCCEAIARNSGLDAELKLGAARGADRMHFHAWVEHAGHIIAGEHDGTFTPLR